MDQSIASLLDQSPGVIDWAWEMSYTLLLVWVVVLLLAPVVRNGQGRLRLLVDYGLALVVSLVVSVGIGVAGGTTAEGSLAALVTAAPPPVYAAVRLALATAVIVTASPHVTRPFRAVGRVIVALGAVSAVALQVAHASGVVAGLAIGVGTAALVHLLLGSPGGQLTPEQVGQALNDLGVPTHQQELVAARGPGEQLVRALTPQGVAIEAKVIGRDAWEAHYAGSLWTALTRRGEVPRLAVSRRERVEHEAMVSLLAERAGVSVLPVVTSGQGIQGEALLVTEAPVGSLAERGAGADSDWLAGSWATMVSLHEAGIAHRRITAANLVVRRDGAIALADFAHARLAAATTDLMIDRVHLLVALSMAFGHGPAVDSAVRGLGADGLAAALPYLQEPVLSPPLRRAMSADYDLEALREVAVGRTGVDPAPLVELRRVTLGSVVKLLVVVVVVSSLVGLLAGVDFQEAAEALATADYSWIVLGLLVAPLAQPLFSISTLSASIARLPYLPVLMLQYAIQFIALVLPASAARLALQLRFFERLGVPYGAATSMGALDSFGGFVVQVMLLLLIGLSSLPGVTVEMTRSTGSSGDDGSSDSSLLALMVIVSLLWALATLAVPRRRARLKRAIPRYWTALKDQAGSAKQALGVLRRPAKVAGLLGGNFGAQLVQAIVLGMCLSAFGESATLSQLILVNTGVSLFAGLMPVPGGVGVAEAGYAYGLQLIGVPAPIAVSTAVAFRLVTFYIPPLWCSQAMRWLRRNAYV